MMYSYRVNFWSSIFKNVILILVYVFFFDGFFGVVGDVILWSFKEFLVFLFFANFTIGVAYLFISEKELEVDIVSGILNKIFLFPGSRVFNYFLFQRDSSVVFLGVYLFLFFPVVLFLVDVSFFNVFLSFGVCFGLGILLAVLFTFLASFSWIFLRLGGSFIMFFEDLERFFRIFPGNFFELSSFRFLFSFMPIYFVGTMVVPLFFGKEIFDLCGKLALIFIFFIFFVVGIWINWSFGLRRFEALG